MHHALSGKGNEVLANASFNDANFCGNCQAGGYFVVCFFKSLNSLGLLQ